MLDRIFPACFKNIVKTYNIRLDILIRISDAPSDSHLCCKIDHNLRAVLLENSLESLPVRYISLHESEMLIYIQLVQTTFLQIKIIITIQIINCDNLRIVETTIYFLNKMTADETGRPCH